MKWMRERDLLIAQTMAFVQSVTGKMPETEAMLATPPTLPPVTLPALGAPEATRAAVPAPEIGALPAVRGVPAEAGKSAALLPRPDLRDDFQSEIKARVANFRAHQERFSRERDAHWSATMARVHAALRESLQPPRPGK